MAQYSVDGGIALVTINNPPVNALAPKGKSSLPTEHNLNPFWLIAVIATDGSGHGSACAGCSYYKPHCRCSCICGVQSCCILMCVGLVTQC